MHSMPGYAYALLFGIQSSHISFFFVMQVFRHASHNPDLDSGFDLGTYVKQKSPCNTNRNLLASFPLGIIIYAVMYVNKSHQEKGF